jgi:small-conductance mechanosensitive channel
MAFGALLILFGNIRNVGASILTSADILSLVASFITQKSLRNLADGLQLIFNQLIENNDWVVIEKEMEPIEDVNLFYVVIKI